MTLRCLFVDFNSYFASVEQEDEPTLRGRPIAVAPVMTESTCCIAASIEAKTFGIRTGTPVWEARERCPELLVVPARPARYLQAHTQLMAAIADCVPHGTPESIDEVPCWLIGRECQRDNAIAIAHSIKRRIASEFAAIRCSIGIAPNKFLAKTASDMQKPDGLVVLERHDLPHALHALELRDLCGIGASMEARLRAAGIDSVEELCASPKDRLRAAWGSVEGERFWMQLRGIDVPMRATQRGSIGHSHVLGPELRNLDGMRAVLFKLLAKAAMRLRNEDDGYLARGLQLHVRFVGLDERFSPAVDFAPIDDTPSLLHLLAKMLKPLERAAASGRWNVKRHPPLSVAATLTGVELRSKRSGELIATTRKRQSITQVLDKVNRQFGNNALYVAAMLPAIEHDAAPMRIPFAHLPDVKLEEDVRTHAHAAELVRLRERQFKVLAEASHKQAQAQRSPRASGPSGASSRIRMPPRIVPPSPQLGLGF
ncbi:DNA polymerase Y family protein [Solilutibacter silvestris]|uniref:ImpB/mucB/samB family n=1 Tax=Solilutibacter silvestris TaxID=1645665 RepID=A0A2K1Q204_9GAMM|nr:DNA polymerase [Lysobacter silvestris]PNS09062.1 impB/mucB/samB family [Lysobacter silvestris]